MNQWNVGLYEEKHSYVWHYGSKLLEMLYPQPQERILDLGCGTGQLTAQIAASGAEVVGLDSSESAIAKAQANYPQIEFRVANGADFKSDRTFEAVFSNAALHWIQPPQDAVKCIWQALKPGGRLVAEFGGKGNVAQILEALNSELREAYNPWYFPSIGEYSTLLEHQGFEVTYAALFSRPTKLKGETGLANWLEMFADGVLSTVTPSTKAEIISRVEAKLRSRSVGCAQSHLYCDGSWFADYKRIRVIATKKG